MRWLRRPALPRDVLAQPRGRSARGSSSQRWTSATNVPAAALAPCSPYIPYNWQRDAAKHVRPCGDIRGAN
eukprot:COSAG05_NODE_14205_length_404_cov_1.009836_1_plen_70_part_10